MLLKSTISVQQEVNIELETPAFFKTIVSGDITEYLGVIEECTINIWDFKGTRTFIENCATEKRTAEITKAYNSWEHISEEEFFEALNKALKDFDFKIGYKETALQVQADQERRAEQWS